MNHEIHPAAALFPMLGEEELTTLQNDISAYGQLEPIITWRGQVVDGRNRLEACRRTGQKPRIKERDFADEDAVINYIISTNIKRRHLTTTERGTIAAKLANLERGSNRYEDKVDGPIGLSKKMSTAEAAKQMQVGERTVKRAKAVLKKSPETFAKVESGELSINAAHKQVAPPKPKPVPVVVPDPDFAHLDDPPPLIPPAEPKKNKHFIPPDPDEDIDAWRETQAEVANHVRVAESLVREIDALCMEKSNQVRASDRIAFNALVANALRTRADSLDKDGVA